MSLSPFYWTHLRAVSVKVTPSAAKPSPRVVHVLKTHAVSLCALAAEFVFWEGFRLTFSVCKRRVASMCLRWRPVRTQGSSSRPRVPKVTPKVHFWGAWATLFEAKVPECCMYDKHTIYHVLTTLGGSGLPVFITRPAFAT